MLRNLKVGFTGTRNGMSERQLAQLGQLLMLLERSQPPEDTPELHHGGAEGADNECDQLACLDGYAIVVHPCPGVVADEIGKYNSHPATWREVFPPLVRNQHIVDEVHMLIAAPETNQEQQRSGTWATVRYARKAGKPVVMLSR